MKKTLIRIISIILASLTLCAGGAGVYADEGIMPRYNTAEDVKLIFTIENGTARVGAKYVATQSDFSYATLTYKIQKKTLGFFWSTVDIGEPNNERTLYCYDVQGDFGLSYSISGTGTYRAVMTLKIYSSSGSYETISENVEYNYN